MPYWILKNHLLRYYIPQISIVFHYIVCDGGVGDGGEVTTDTFNLYAFCTTVIRHFVVTIAFGFGYKIDVFDVSAFLEHYCPVGIIVSGRSVDLETAR